MVLDINTTKKFHTMVEELFIKCRKLNIPLVFIAHLISPYQKEVRLNYTHYVIIKIHNKKEFNHIVINNSADIDYKDFINIYRKCASEPYFFFTIDTILSADHPLRFKKNLLDLF